MWHPRCPTSDPLSYWHGGSWTEGQELQRSSLWGLAPPNQPMSSAPRLNKTLRLLLAVQGVFWILASTLHVCAAVFPCGWVQQTSSLFCWELTESYGVTAMGNMLRLCWKAAGGTGAVLVSTQAASWSLFPWVTCWLFFQAGLVCSLFESTPSIKTSRILRLMLSPLISSTVPGLNPFPVSGDYWLLKWENVGVQ